MSCQAPASHMVIYVPECLFTMHDSPATCTHSPMHLTITFIDVPQPTASLHSETGPFPQQESPQLNLGDQHQCRAHSQSNFSTSDAQSWTLVFSTPLKSPQKQTLRLTQFRSRNIHQIGTYNESQALPSAGLESEAGQPFRYNSPSVRKA